MKLLRNLTIAAVGAASFSVSAPAKAVDPCQGPVSGSTLFDGYSCQSGDKIYSGFNTESTTLNSDFTFFNILDQTSIHTISAIGNFQPSIEGGFYSYSYTVSIAPEYVGQRQIFSYSTGASTSDDSTWTKKLTSTGNPAVAKSTQASEGGTSGPSKFFPGVTTADFISEFTITAGTATIFTDGVKQIREPGDSVPGPLPLLGAGAAFGFSRKLRRRIKLAA